MSGRSMIVWALTKRGTAKSNNKLLNFDLQTGSFEVLADDLRKPFQTWISPGRDFLIYSFHDEKAAQEVLAKLDLRNLQREEIYRGSSIEMFRLNKDGDKIAFLAEKGKLGLYLFSEKRIIALVEYKSGKAPSRVHSLEWVSAGEELVLGDNLENGSCLRVFGMDLAEKKAIKIPFSLEYVQLTALNEFVFVWNYRTSELWTVNIDTEKCQRVI
jgi:tricorn protease-like protein